MGRLTVEKAAEIMGVSKQKLRVGLQRGAYPFGVAYKAQEDNQIFTYEIFPEKFFQYYPRGEEAS